MRLHFRILVVLLATASIVVSQYSLAIDDPNVKEICQHLTKNPGDISMLAKLKTAIKSVTDVDEKGRLIVIYCLGCIYTGQNDEAASIKAYLEKTYSEDPNLKYLSSQYVSEPCADCGGTGVKLEECRRCNGTGTCSVCKGRGSRRV